MVTEQRRVRLNNSMDLCFIFKPISSAKVNNLKSQLEIKFNDLIDATKKEVKELESHPHHIICESGWSFNKPANLVHEFPDFRLFYFVLSPSKNTLRRNYLERHPHSKKHIATDSDWTKYESTMFKRQRKQIEDLKLKLDQLKIQYVEFQDEELADKVSKAKQILMEVNPTVFVITGPNASGKSTLLYKLMKEFGIVLPNMLLCLPKG